MSQGRLPPIQDVSAIGQHVNVPRTLAFALFPQITSLTYLLAPYLLTLAQRQYTLSFLAALNSLLIAIS